MAIITISRGSYSRGMDVAEKVAEKLGYECIGREALLQTSREYDVDEVKLVRTTQDTTAVLDSLIGGKERYAAHIQAALTSRVKKDNVVYHGLAGQFLLPGVSHVLKVRIIAPLEYRINIVMDRDNVERQKAISILRKDDEERNRWSRKLFLIDPRDCNLYDLTLNIDKCTVVDAAVIICQTAGFEGFQTTPESQKAMDDLQLACAVKVRLVDVMPNVEVSSDNGNISVIADAPVTQEEAVTREIRRIAETVPGVDDVLVQVRRLASQD
jgi:cytidylate kinase